MTPFHVRWERTALDELTRLSLQADSELRAAITTAVHKIDLRLQEKGDEEGESRPDDRRISFEAPLAVTFRVEESVVSVLHVWRFRNKAFP